MATIDLKTLSGRYNVREFGLKGGGKGDDRAAINNAILQASVDGGGVVEIPADAGVVLVSGPILARSNVELVIPRGITVRLIASKDVPLLQAAAPAVNNFRLTGGGILDGNRANQDGDNDQVPLGLAMATFGIYLDGVTDLVIEGITAQSCYSHGIALSGCSRPRLIGVRATDNGHHGILLDNVSGGILLGCHAWDNSKVETAGTGDGVHLNNGSVDNVIAALRAYDSSADAKRQAYGVREEASSGCDRNTILAYALDGNLTGPYSLIGTDSRAVDSRMVTYGTPSISLGTVADAGSADSVIRSDATIAAFDDEDPSTQAFGDAADPGVATKAARRDHKHKMPVVPSAFATSFLLGG